MEFASFVGLFIEYGYFLVFIAVFLDKAGLPLPGELALLAFGFLARMGHVLSARAFLMPLAGPARLPYGQFLVFDAIGAVFWSGVFLGVGYALGNQVEAFSGRFRQGEVVLGSALGIAVVVYLGVKLWRRPRYGVGLIEAEGR